jgi:ferric iron reductase protein FhuF
MEGDIILEGFLEAESKHGLRYMQLVGDGDSSVFSRMILEKTEGTRLGEICCQRRVC